MQPGRVHASTPDLAPGEEDRWYVSTGNRAVGPVKLEQLARGVAAGKVPTEAFIRHEGWRVWRPISDIADLAATAPARDTQPPASVDAP